MSTAEASETQSTFIVWRWMERVGSRNWAVALVYLAIFAILNWRLFAIGSDAQLFLYGDNLTTLNNLYSIFQHFSITDPFRTFVGQGDTGSSYVMSEPQNSIFYAPFFVLFVVYKLFGLNSQGLYYELLVNHTAHIVLGTYLVFRIANRFVGLNRHYSFIAGLIFMGLGWNAGWFGTNTLSYMAGMVPLTMYAFLRCCQATTRRNVALYVLATALLLFAGGAANYFFYLWLNSILVFALFAVFKVESIVPHGTRRTTIRNGAVLLILAPVVSVAIYAVQLVATIYVQPDITHTSTAYDDLSMFGNHFGDLIGLLLPMFGSIGFGTTSNPTFSYKFLNAHLFYVGMLPLMLLASALVAVRNRVSNIFVVLILLNLLLSFGGMFVLYDATLFFPGNSGFRGHYKYLTYVGMYLAIVCAMALQRLTNDVKLPASWKRLNWVAVIWCLLLGTTGIVLAILTLDSGTTSIADVSQHYDALLSGLNYVLRSLAFLVLTLVALNLTVQKRTNLLHTILAAVFIFDFSINYKLASNYDTKVAQLTSKKFFSCCDGKTVVNNLDGYSQIYVIPEIIGTHPTFVYTAIPNKYMAEYNNHFLNESGAPNLNFFRAAGVDGIMTNSTISAGEFQLKSDEKIDATNYRDFYHYNPDGQIHHAWGGLPSQEGADVRYYELKDSKPVSISIGYIEDADQQKALDYLKDHGGQLTAFVTGSAAPPNTAGGTSAVSVVTATPTKKTYQVTGSGTSRFLSTNTAYSRIWKARVDGKSVSVDRVNYAFAGVRLPDDSSGGKVELYVDQRPLQLGLLLSALTLVATLALLIPTTGRRRNQAHKTSEL